MKIALRKIRPGLAVNMDARGEAILAVGHDGTGQFIVTSGWNGQTSTIWHRHELPVAQHSTVREAFRRSGLSRKSTNRK